VNAAQANQTEEVRRALVDPERVARRLGLLGKDSRKQAGGVIVRCPVHGEKTPSCSLTRGPDGTLRARCFGCQWTGDALSLVAAVRGLNLRGDFRAVLAAAAEVGGLHELAAEIETGRAPTALRVVPPPPEPEPERDYPPASEVEAVWQAALPVAEVEPAAVALALRGLFPGSDLARAITDSSAAGSARPESTWCQQSASGLPGWARYQGRTWLETGHRIVLPVYDHTGAMRSLRAWQVDARTEGPKRLPPAGHRATGLVLANEAALRWLRAPAEPIRLLVAEGEPDFLTLAQAYPAAAVIGVGSGSWTQAFAERVPFGSLVAIHTHHDAAGDRYAAELAKTLASRARVKRGTAP
jgi:hypothetical protein